MRLLILIAVIYLCFRALKSWILQNSLSNKTVTTTKTGEIDDIMVKDPFCEVYFPKRDGIHLRANGKDLYFCGKECKDKFIALHSKK